MLQMTFDIDYSGTLRAPYPGAALQDSLIEITEGGERVWIYAVERSDIELTNESDKVVSADPSRGRPVPWSLIVGGVVATGLLLGAIGIAKSKPTGVVWKALYESTGSAWTSTKDRAASSVTDD